MPGHGKSAAQDTIRAQDDVPDAVMACIDEVHPNEQFGLVGLSCGSYIARGIVHRSPCATLAVPDTAGHTLGWERPEVFQALVRDWLERMAAV